MVMLIGYNTNIRYKGKTYHVQTEDSGPTNPQIVTLLYYHGAILSSKKTSYAHLLGQPDLEDRLRELMKQQHREMIRELKNIEGSGIGGNEGSGEEDNLLAAMKENNSTLIDDAQEGRSIARYRQDACATDKESAEIKKGLDDILIDFITKRCKK